MAVPDYSLGMVQPSQVDQSFSRGLQDGMMLGESAQQSQDRARLIADQAAAKAATDAAAKQQAEAKAQQQADFIEAAKAPTAQKTAALIVKYPSMADGLTKAYTALNDQEKQSYTSLAQRAHAAQLGGRPDTAAKILREAATAYTNSGMTDRAKALEDTARNVEENKDVATLTLGGFLASTMGPENYSKTYETAATIVATSDEAKAKASKAAVDARFAEDTIKANIQYTKDQSTRLGAMTRNEAGKLNIDRKQLELATLKELNDAGVRMGELPAAAQKQVSDAALDVAAGNTSIEQVTTLAKDFDGLDVAGGYVAKVGSYARGLVGMPDDESLARQKYQGLIDGLIAARYKGLGTMSDGDRESARKAYPDPFGATEPIASFLKENARTTERTVRLKKAEVEYIAQNRGLGPARQPLVIGGARVEAGETFDKVVDRIEADVKATKDQATSAAKSRAATSVGIKNGLDG